MLNSKQRVFVEEYLTCWNASEAARRAGYKTMADSQGARMMLNAGVKEAIEQRIAEKAMTADEVLIRLAEQARANVVDFMDETARAVQNDEGETTLYQSGALKWEELRKRGHLVKRISFNQYGPIIEMVDGQAALVHIGRHFKLFTDRVEQEQEVKIIWDLPTSESAS